MQAEEAVIKAATDAWLAAERAVKAVAAVDAACLKEFRRDPKLVSKLSRWEQAGEQANLTAIQSSILVTFAQCANRQKTL